MADSSDSGSSKYNQEIKEQSRSKLIEHAVRCLTTERSTSVCVKRDHVKRVWQQLLDSGEAKEYFEEKERKQIKTQIDKWEAFHKGKVGKKEASALRVCYLAGDDPTNDLKVFVEYGVDCRNVVAIEKDPKTSNKAWNAINNSAPDSDFRNVKLVTDDILTFLKEDKAQFDIIYLDACGSLPSAKQNTLKIVGYVFRYNKLESPGALITNFSFPPQNTQQENSASSQDLDEEREKLNFLVKEYMKNRLWNVMHGDNSPEYLSKRTDEDNYGDYVSYQVIDSAYLFIPAQRMLESESTSLWGQMFRKKEHFLEWINSYSSANAEGTTKGTNEKSAKTTRNQELMQVLKKVKVDGKGAKPKCGIKLETLRKKLEKEHEVHTSNNLFSNLMRMAEAFLEESNNRWCEAWINEIFPNRIPEKSLDEEEEKEREKERKKIPSMLLTPLLISSPSHIIYFSNVDFVLKCLAPLFKAIFEKKFPFCCDEATFQQTCLVAGLLYGLMTFPSFPVMDKLFRLRYTARKRQMFADVFVFDKCRYVFEQFNGVSTGCFAIEDLKKQIVFRMVVDGLRKHLGGICSEDLFRCCIVPSINEIVDRRVSFPNSYRRIPDRQELEYLLLKEKAYRSKLGFFGLFFPFLRLFICIILVFYIYFKC
ncbi:uncharacterized protein [Acropora muricata]|uniref:uncharacterized protein n=1 Tax=Acropora muricata TaxID=159855 RepID=UPI0034E45D9F